MRRCGPVLALVVALVAAPLATADPPDRARSLMAEARSNLKRGRYAVAERKAGKARGLIEADSGADSADLAPCLSLLGQAIERRGRFDEALAHHERALTLATGDAWIYHRALCRHYRVRGTYGDAIPHCESALRTLEGEDTAADVAKLELAVAELTEYSGRYDDAAKRYARVLQLRVGLSGDKDWRVANVVAAQARLAIKAGDYVAAERLQERALALREAALPEGHANIGVSLKQLARLCHRKGDYERAEQLYRRSAEILTASLGRRHVDVVGVLDRLGALLSDTGRFADALPLHERALKERRRAYGRSHPAIASGLHNLARARAGLGKRAAARRLHERALTMREKTLGDDRIEVAETLDELAALDAADGKADRALRLAERSLAITEKRLGPTHPDVATALIRVAGYREAAGGGEGLSALYSRATDLQEVHLLAVLAVGTEVERRLFVETLRGSTERIVAWALRATTPLASRIAVTTLLRRKGRALDAARSSWSRLRGRLDDDARGALARLEGVRERLGRLAWARPAGSEREGVDAERAALALEAQALESTLSRSSAEFRHAEAPADLLSVAASLPRGALLVAWAASRDRYVGWALDRSGILTLADLGDRADIDATVLAFTRAVRGQSPPMMGLGKMLYGRLLGPFEARVRAAKSLILSPDGELNLLPFAALTADGDRFLLEDLPVRSVTSARELLRPPPTVTADAPLVVAAPDYGATGAQPARRVALRSSNMSRVVVTELPGTRVEARAVQATLMLPGDRVLTGRAATESALEAAPRPRILHIATHGFFLPSPKKPTRTRFAADRTEPPLLRSGLALAGFNVRHTAKGGDDGVLTALELASLDLEGTELVVLSACETGLGVVRAGDGVYGLKRAVVLAGARSQIVTLWRVDDTATQLLMSDLYANLGKGADRAEALRQVQLAMRSGRFDKHRDRSVIVGEPEDAWPGYRHPRFWAAFTLSGATGPVPM